MINFGGRNILLVAKFVVRCVRLSDHSPCSLEINLFEIQGAIAPIASERKRKAILRFPTESSVHIAFTCQKSAFFDATAPKT